MVVKNEAQFRERIKHTLNRYIEAMDMLNRGLILDCEDDGDVIEWSEEEKDSGDAYFSIDSLESFKPSGIHMSSSNFALVAKTLGLPISLYDFKYSGEDKYEPVFIYRDVIFFCLLEKSDLPKFEETGVEIVKMGKERDRV